MHVYAQIDGKCSLLPVTERIWDRSSSNDSELISKSASLRKSAILGIFFR